MFSKYVSHLVWIGFFAPWFLNSSHADADGLSRQEAIQIALEANPEVIAAQKAWEAARARITQASAWPDPELELEYEELPEVGGFGDFGERSIGVTQAIEFPLKWWHRRQAAGQAARATRLAGLEMTRLDIGTRVKVAYDRVLFRQVKLGYASAGVELAQDVLEKARLRLEAGDVPQLEVLRAEVEAGRAANRLNEARSALAVARAELNTLMARERGAPLEMVGALDYQPTKLELESLQQLALERRPDLQGAEWSLAGARAAQGTARAAFLPDLNLSLFRQTIQEPAGKMNYWRVGLALEVPLWGAGRQRGEWAEARAVAEQTAAEIDHVRNQILLEVERAFLKVQTSSRQVQLVARKKIF